MISAVASNAVGKTPSSSSTTTPPSTTTTGNTSPAAAAAALPQPGTAVYDGDFKFVVQGMTCGAAAESQVYPADGLETMPPGSTECIVTLKVTNDKGKAQTFFDSNQYAYDAAGRKYNSDDNAIFASGDQAITQVNPGVTITAPVAYNLPAGDSLVKLDLHDSAFSGGTVAAT